MNSPKRWPDDYQDWTGNFDELVETARCIQQEQHAPADKLLNPRLVRHYQSKGVGRGIREGRASRFGFADLAALLATKGMVEEGWTVSNAAPLANSVPAPALATLTSSYGSSSPSSAAAETAASRLVRELMGDALPHGTPTFSTSGGGGHKGLLRGAVAYAQGQPSASNALAAHFSSRLTAAAAPDLHFGSMSVGMPTTPTAIAPWLSLDFDAAAAAAATPEEREEAQKALRAWSKRHLG